MSANPVARPQSSRRAFLTAGTAALVGGASAGALAAAAAAPDPVFVALRAEEVAWEAFGRTAKQDDLASSAWRQSGFDRQPRVQVGILRRMVKGAELEPIPLDQQIDEPIYLHSRAQIDQHERDPERGERFYRELEADRQAIEHHPLHIAAQKAGETNDAALEAWSKVYREALAIRPTTVAGALALMARFEARDGDMAPDWDLIRAVFDGVRSVLGGRA